MRPTPAVRLPVARSAAVALLLGATVYAAEPPPAPPAPAAPGPAAPAAREIAFDELACYFVKNTVKVEQDRPMCLILSTSKAFEETFGVGMVMGANRAKLLQEGDFKDHVVVSVMQSGNDIRDIRIKAIRLEDTTLVIEFTNTVTEANASWTGNFHATVRMKRCAFTAVRLVENGKARTDVPIRQQP